jgi:hypothetical protein
MSFLHAFSGDPLRLFWQEITAGILTVGYQESQRDLATYSRLNRTLRYTNDEAVGTQDADFLSL